MRIVGMSPFTNSGAGAAVPATPTNLVATDNNNGNQIDLTWTDVAINETGYQVQRKTGAGGTYANLGGQLPAGSISYTDTGGLAGGQQYFYRVFAFNANGNSSFSNEDDATIPNALNVTHVYAVAETTSMVRFVFDAPITSVFVNPPNCLAADSAGNCTDATITGPNELTVNFEDGVLMVGEEWTVSANNGQFKPGIGPGSGTIEEG